MEPTPELALRERHKDLAKLLPPVTGHPARFAGGALRDLRKSDWISPLLD